MDTSNANEARIFYGKVLTVHAHKPLSRLLSSVFAKRNSFAGRQLSYTCAHNLRYWFLTELGVCLFSIFNYDVATFIFSKNKNKVYCIHCKDTWISSFSQVSIIWDHVKFAQNIVGIKKYVINTKMKDGHVKHFNNMIDVINVKSDMIEWTIFARACSWTDENYKSDDGASRQRYDQESVDKRSFIFEGELYKVGENLKVRTQRRAQVFPGLLVYSGAWSGSASNIPLDDAQV